MSANDHAPRRRFDPEIRQLGGAIARPAPGHGVSLWGASHFYMNFSERPIDSRMLYPHTYAHDRLRAVKAKYDPGDMIQSNHPIPPAR